jgi:hypothetical protein
MGRRGRETGDGGERLFWLACFILIHRGVLFALLIIAGRVDFHREILLVLGGGF